MSWWFWRCAYLGVWLSGDWDGEWEWVGSLEVGECVGVLVSEDGKGEWVSGFKEGAYAGVLANGDGEGE